MLQSNTNLKYSNSNFVSSNDNYIDITQRTLRSIPRQVQYNEVLHSVDININNIRRPTFMPQIQTPTNAIYGRNQLSDKQYIKNTVTPQLVHRNAPASNCLIPKDVGPRDSPVAGPSKVQDNIFLPPPVPVATATTSNGTKRNVTRNANAENSLSTETGTSNNLNFKVFGSTENERMFIFTGTAERVIKWNKIFQNQFCYFEVIASIISIQEGSVRTQKIMLLRDRKGPILQVVYYVTTHIDIEDFHVGQILRCVGKMIAHNILNAVSIRTASQEEMETLQRLCLVCDHAVSHFLNV